MFVSSALSFGAVGIYGVVILCCVTAMQTARRARQVPSHGRTWLLLALLFAFLIVWRAFAAEEWLRSFMRESLRSTSSYDERRSLQTPIVATAISIVGIGGLLLLYRWSKLVHGRRNIALHFALLAGLAMLFLIALRLASLHAVDMALYGPLKLNWIFDIFSSFVVLGSAIYYVQIVGRNS